MYSFSAKKAIKYLTELREYYRNQAIICQRDYKNSIETRENEFSRMRNEYINRSAFIGKVLDYISENERLKKYR